jgi:hypothetical protein
VDKFLHKFIERIDWLYINCNNDDIQHKRLVAEPGISALDAFLTKYAISFLAESR